MRPKKDFPSVATAWLSAGDGLAFTVTRRVRDGLPLRPIACGIPGPATRLRKAPERSSLRELGSR
jgi:hypothetical protein